MYAHVELVLSHVISQTVFCTCAKCMGCDMHTEAHAQQGLNNIYLRMNGSSMKFVELLLAGAWVRTSQPSVSTV